MEPNTMSTNNEIYGIVILSKDTIKEDQNGIRTTLLGLDARVHANAVQCMIHAEIHGDTSLMRRLLVDTISEVTGYRRQGLLNWVRKYSPMELKGKDNIDLSGTDNDGNRRPFKVEAANKTPFWLDADNNEMVAKPVFRDALTGKLEAAIREFENAVSNTVYVNGKPHPVDPKKGYYDGVQVDKVEAFFTGLKTNVYALKSEIKDDTRDVRLAQAQLRKSLAGVSAEEAKKIIDEVTGPQPEVHAAA